MKKIIAVVLVAAMVLTMSGCSAVFDAMKSGVSEIADGYAGEFKNNVTLSGEVAEEEVSPADGKKITSVVLNGASFNAINGGTAFIKIIPSAENRVEIKYQSDIKDHGFAVTAKNGELKISTDRKIHFRTECFEVTVYANCDSVSINGGIELIMDGVSTESLEIDVQGAVKAQITDAHADSMSIKVDGAGEFDINGDVDTFSAEFNGAGELRAKELVCKDASINVFGAGDVEISCTGTLSTDISGVGSVGYYGSPALSLNNSGAAAVTQKSADIYRK